MPPELTIADLIDGSHADATLEGYSGARIHLTADAPYGLVDIGDGRWGVCRLAVVPMGPPLGSRAEAEAYARQLREDVASEREKHDRDEQARDARSRFTLIESE